MMKSAAFSSDRQYRYALWRVWDEQKPICMFIGLNPSTANETQDDPTIRRCESFAGNWGYGGLCMTNLFAFVSTDPRVLHNVQAIGDENDAWLVYLAAYSGIVIASWGQFEEAVERAEMVRKMIPVLYCLGKTKGGQPRHPLYLAKGTKLREYLL